jgi:hypothetical protein
MCDEMVEQAFEVLVSSTLSLRERGVPTEGPDVPT